MLCPTLSMLLLPLFLPCCRSPPPAASRHLSPPVLILSMLVADGVPAWKALAVSMLPSPQTWNLEAMRSMRPLGWNILLAGAVLG